MPKRWIVLGVLAAAIGATCLSRTDEPLLVANPSTCIGGASASPTYDGVISQILDTNCASCHASDVRRYGAPSYLRLDGYKDDPLGATYAYGPEHIAGCLCVSTVQAIPDSPVRMPFQPVQGPLCDADRETLRTWINLSVPKNGAGQPAGIPCLRREEISCLTPDGGVPEAPVFDTDVKPILRARCATCHTTPGQCFDDRFQQRFTLAEETVAVPDGDGGFSFRGVGAFEYRGEIVRAAVNRLSIGVNFIGPMPYQPNYGGTATRSSCPRSATTTRRSCGGGRRVASAPARRRCCPRSASPRRSPTRRPGTPTSGGSSSRAAGCAMASSTAPAERSRSGPLRARRSGSDNYARVDGGDPGVTDEYTDCVDVNPDTPSMVKVFPLLATMTFPIVDGGVAVAGRTLPVVPGPCVAGGTATQHVVVTLPLLDYVQALAIDNLAMPYNAATGVRAGLCDNDKQTILRWRSQGTPLQ